MECTIQHRLRWETKFPSARLVLLGSRHLLDLGSMASVKSSQGLLHSFTWGLRLVKNRPVHFVEKKPGVGKALPEPKPRKVTSSDDRAFSCFSRCAERTRQFCRMKISFKTRGSRYVDMLILLSGIDCVE